MLTWASGCVSFLLAPLALSWLLSGDGSRTASAWTAGVLVEVVSILWYGLVNQLHWGDQGLKGYWQGAVNIYIVLHWMAGGMYTRKRFVNQGLGDLLSAHMGVEFGFKLSR